MLPPAPPTLKARDLDPAQYNPDGEEIDEESRSQVELSSIEINILIYLYLLESNFSHTAYVLLNESSLPSTSLFQHFNPSYPSPSSANPRASSSSAKPNGIGTPGPSTGKGDYSPMQTQFGRAEGRIERGELVRKLWKGLRWEEIERHVSATGEPYKPECPNPFHLLIPHVCPPSYPSSSNNQPTNPAILRISPPPTTNRIDPFPPPSVAGPSKPSEATQTQPELISAMKTVSTQTTAIDLNLLSANGNKGKRKARPNSPSSSRNDSPGPSTASPRVRSKALDADMDNSGVRKEKTEKKRARISEGNVGGVGKKKEREEIEDTAMDVDEEVEKSNGDVGGDKESSEATAKQKGTASKGKGKADNGNGVVTTVERSPIWIPDSDIGVWTEHRDNVTCLAWNPKNVDVLASGSNDGFVRLWDLHQDDEKKALKLGRKPTAMSHKGVEASLKNITAVSWHPDGTVLATACIDGVGRLFTPSGQLQGIMSYGRGAITALKFSPSGKEILAAKDNFTVCLWGLGPKYNQMMKTCFESHTKEVNDVDWLDDDVFASGSNDHTIFIHRTNDKRPRYTLKGHTDDVTRLRWSPALPGQPIKSRLLASVSDDGYCMIWRLTTYPVDRGSGSRSTSPTKSGGGNGVIVYNSNLPDDYFHGVDQGRIPGMDYCLNRMEVVSGSENKRMNSLEWSPACTEGSMILAAGGQDSTVKLFNAISGECLHVLSGLETGTGSIAFSPFGFGGKLGSIAAGGWNGKLLVWDVETGELKKEYEVEEDTNRQSQRTAPMMTSMAWRNDGQQLALGLHNKSVMTVFVGDLTKGEGEGKVD